MNRRRPAIQKLIASARKAHEAPRADESSSAPLGFATRVAARWAARPPRSSFAGAWERLCWWGAGASLAVCLMVFVNQSLQPEPNPFDALMEAPEDALEIM